VFPELSPDEIDTASTYTVDNWDSLRAVTLVAAIEEEFNIEFELEDMLSFTSFKAVHDRAMQKIGSANAKEEQGH
jgi:acyl carrier protein